MISLCSFLFFNSLVSMKILSQHAFVLSLQAFMTNFFATIFRSDQLSPTNFRSTNFRFPYLNTQHVAFHENEPLFSVAIWYRCTYCDTLSFHTVTREFFSVVSHRRQLLCQTTYLMIFPCQALRN